MSGTREMRGAADRWEMRIAVILGSLLVALVGAGSAHAECTSTSDAGRDAEIVAPSTAAAGTTIRVQAYVVPGSPDLHFDISSSMLPVEAADPTKPISHPSTREGGLGALFDVTVDTMRGDGPVRVRLSWDEDQRVTLSNGD